MQNTYRSSATENYNLPSRGYKTFKPNFNAGNYSGKQTDPIGRCYGGYSKFYSTGLSY
ncbi:MAG: hypothetical protein AABX29_04220 [Nanoarchaeota archaeon]